MISSNIHTDKTTFNQLGLLECMNEMSLIETDVNNQSLFEWQNIKIKKNKDAIINYFKLDIHEHVETEEKENFDKNQTGFDIINQISIETDTK